MYSRFGSRRKLPSICAVVLLVMSLGAGCAGDDGDGGPLAGYWSETGRIDCVTGETTAWPPTPIEELKITAQTMFVTWFPFEVGYFDYQADYTADLEAGVIELQDTIPWGTNPPADIDGTGGLSLSADGETMTLSDFWFGTPPIANPDANYPRRCGHTFARSGPARDGR